MKHAVRSSSMDHDTYPPHPEAPVAAEFLLEAELSSPFSSPARALQKRLHASLDHEPVVEKWPAAVRLGFVVMSAASLWMIPIAAVRYFSA